MELLKRAKFNYIFLINLMLSEVESPMLIIVIAITIRIRETC